jgi:hypothetical protein
MKKISIILFLLIGICQLSFSQVYYEENEVKEKQEEEGIDKENNPNSLSGLSFAERSYFGGNLALSFGSNTYIDVSPLWGYMINSNLSMGLGGTYIYSSREYLDPFSGRTFKVDGSLYGGRTFLRYRLFDNIYFHSEFETINVELPANGGGTEREWVPGVFFGGGIFQPAFGRGGVSLFVLYNVVHDELKSPYGSPWVIRVGFTL